MSSCRVFSLIMTSRVGCTFFCSRYYKLKDIVQSPTVVNDILTQNMEPPQKSSSLGVREGDDIVTKSSDMVCLSKPVSSWPPTPETTSCPGRMRLKNESKRQLFYLLKKSWLMMKVSWNERLFVIIVSQVLERKVQKVCAGSLLVSSAVARGNKTRNTKHKRNEKRRRFLSGQIQVVWWTCSAGNKWEIFLLEPVVFSYLRKDIEIALVSCFTSLPHGLLPCDDYHSLFTLIIDSLFFSG